MKPERGVRIFRGIAALYDQVGNIHFFGGEPLLNPKCIDAVCAEARAVFPDIKFTATTNGTLPTDEILDMLGRWGVELTISVDGPAPVHDARLSGLAHAGAYRRGPLRVPGTRRAVIAPWGGFLNKIYLKRSLSRMLAVQQIDFS